MPYYPYPLQQYGQNVMQTQNNNFVSVRSEQEARNYPVAYGNSVTFKDETSPYVYTKTMGFSQLDRPVFEKYKLIKESTEEPVEEKEYSKPNDLQEQIDLLWKEVNYLKKKRGGNNEHNADGKSV